MNQRTQKSMQKQCDDFNARYLVGQSIKFWTGPREGAPTHEGVIRFPAEIMGGHTPVVYVEGKGSIALSHIGGPAPAPVSDMTACEQCQGSGYGGHPDSGALCSKCGGAGAYQSQKDIA